MNSLLARDHNLRLHSADDALDVISSGLPGCIFTPAELHPEFFDLSNQIAGDIMQKLVNYRFATAFVLDEDHDYSPRVDELIIDHRQHPIIRFFYRVEDAQVWMEQIQPTE